MFLVFSRTLYSKTFFLSYKYNMPGRRLIGAGAGILTSGNQGGGDKKQGLVSTTNTRSQLVHRIRTRADGGKSRHWIFCINQLGGVGHKYGQAAGPAAGRSGVSEACSALARESRMLWMRRPKQGSGYGPPGHRGHGDRTPPVLGGEPLVPVEPTPGLGDGPKLYLPKGITQGVGFMYGPNCASIGNASCNGVDGATCRAGKYGQPSGNTSVIQEKVGKLLTAAQAAADEVASRSTLPKLCKDGTGTAVVCPNQTYIFYMSTHCAIINGKVNVYDGNGTAIPVHDARVQISTSSDQRRVIYLGAYTENGVQKPMTAAILTKILAGLPARGDRPASYWRAYCIDTRYWADGTDLAEINKALINAGAEHQSNDVWLTTTRNGYCATVKDETITADTQIANDSALQLTACGENIGNVALIVDMRVTSQSIATARCMGNTNVGGKMTATPMQCSVGNMDLAGGGSRKTLNGAAAAAAEAIYGPNSTTTKLNVMLGSPVVPEGGAGWCPSNTTDCSEAVFPFGNGEGDFPWNQLIESGTADRGLKVTGTIDHSVVDWVHGQALEPPPALELAESDGATDSTTESTGSGSYADSTDDTSNESGTSTDETALDGSTAPTTYGTAAKTTTRCSTCSG